jgi:hypothetical protein
MLLNGVRILLQIVSIHINESQYGHEKQFHFIQECNDIPGQQLLACLDTYE